MPKPKSKTATPPPASEYRSELLRVLHERGFIHQCTDGEALDASLSSGSPVTGYIGFDCTAPSLHVGSLIQIMILRWMQKLGHKPIVLLGGATTRVGDPSGKDESRKIMTAQEVEDNMAAIRGLFANFLSVGNATSDAMIVNNADWLDHVNYIDFLRDVGKHFSVNRMLTQDSVKLRLERDQHLSFLEFNYMALQAYDFVQLAQRYNCHLQIGGSDQWGNIVMGIELHRRLRAGEKESDHSSFLDPTQLMSLGKVLSVQPMIQSRQEDTSVYGQAHFAAAMSNVDDRLFGLTTPLLTTAQGQKMGKTASGAVWLSADMLTPYAYWQFWRNTADADVPRFLRLFTDLPMKEIKKLEALEGAELNDAKKTLANEATRIAHGERAARTAAETARRAFVEKSDDEGLPSVEISLEKLGRGLPAYELFRAAGLGDSGADAKRLIRGGGARINARKVTDEAEMVTLASFGNDRKLKLTAGKKRHVIVKLEA